MNDTLRSGRKSPDRSAPRLLAMLGLLLVSGGLVALGGFLLVHSWKPKTLKVHMLTDLDPNKAMLAQQMAAESRRHGLEIELSSRPVGALEALDLIDRPNPIDLALVTAGIGLRDYHNVRLVTTMAATPMHVVVRPELAEGGLSRLKGRRLNLGPTSMDTHAVARDLLSFAGFHAPDDGARGDYEIDQNSPTELERRLAALTGLDGAERQRAIRELPDAVFLLSPMPSFLIKDLVTLAGYRLVSLPFAEAYCLDRISPTATGEVRVDRASFFGTEIPAYIYGIDPAVPPTPCRTVSSRLLLISYAPTSPEAVARLLETVYDGPVARLADPLPLRGQVAAFAFHPGTELFMRRNEPFLTPELMTSLGKFAGGLGAFASGIVAFYGFLRLRQLRRFESYYHEIRRLELIARGHEADPDAPSDPPALRGYLEDKLLDLKSQALKDFAEGGLKGDSLMSGIVALVNDTRSSLERLCPGPGEEAMVRIVPARTELRSGTAKSRS